MKSQGPCFALVFFKNNNSLTMSELEDRHHETLKRSSVNLKSQIQRIAYPLFGISIL